MKDNKQQIINSKIEELRAEFGEDISSDMLYHFSQSLNEVWEEAHKDPFFSWTTYNAGYKKALEDVMGVIPNERTVEIKN